MTGRRTRTRKQAKLMVETFNDKRNTPASKDQAHEQQTLFELPTELLQVIISQLSLRDNIRASVVCKQWKDASITVRRADKPPWLMSFNRFKHMYQFYDPLHRKIHWLELPELSGGLRVCYAKEGWLLLYKPKNQTLFFYCPYTRGKIDLPSLELGSQIITFSSAPTSSSCIVFTVKPVSLVEVKIMTCHPGASRWTIVNCEDRSFFVSSLCSRIVSCNGLFCCLNTTGWLGIYKPEKGTWTINSVPPPTCPENFFAENWNKGMFVAEHNGDIFLIYTCFSEHPMIYKLDQTNKVWVEMKTLCGMSLFISYMSSIVRADLLGPMRNNVYFAKVRYCGRRCFSYSLNDRRCYPRNQSYDWGKEDTYKCWVDAPQDLSIFR